MHYLKYFISLACLVYSGHNYAQNLFRDGIIYIVRHAEKLKGKDPVLSPEGERRSGDLLQKLKKHPPQLIYVSQYKRTAMTADSLRLQMNIDTVHYVAEETGDSLLKKIGTNEKCILIIAHSNTIPAILKKLIPSVDIVITDEMYDDLFIIRYKKGRPIFKRKKYGAANSTLQTNQMHLQ